VARRYGFLIRIPLLNLVENPIHSEITYNQVISRYKNCLRKLARRLIYAIE